MIVQRVSEPGGDDPVTISNAPGHTGEDVLASGRHATLGLRSGSALLSFEPPAEPDAGDRLWFEGFRASRSSTPAVPPAGLRRAEVEEWEAGRAFGSRAPSLDLTSFVASRWSIGEDGSRPAAPDAGRDDLEDFDGLVLDVEADPDPALPREGGPR